MALLSNADLIKACLVDILIKKHGENCLFGSELAFGTKRRYADLVMIKGNKIFGFEVKAFNDDLRDLEGQLSSYRSVFDYLYIVLTANHLNNAKKVLKETDGIILINSKLDLTSMRKAKVIYSKSKSEIIGTMTVKFLKDHFEISQNLSSNILRNSLEKNKLEVIQMALKSYFEKKLLPRNKLFFSERGIVTHYEDITLLSFGYKGVLSTNKVILSFD